MGLAGTSEESGGLESLQATPWLQIHYNSDSLAAGDWLPVQVDQHTVAVCRRGRLLKHGNH